MNAPYDARFKILAEGYPDLLLRLLGIVVPGTKTQTIDVIFANCSWTPVQVDHVYRIGDGDAARLVHFEAITSWRTRRVPLLALYHFLLEHKYKLPVSSYVVLMAEKYAHESAPPRAVYEREDGLRIEAPYQMIRLWEINPSMAFEPGCEPLLPWVPLLKGGAAEFEQASSAIEWLYDHREKAPYPVEVMVNNLAVLATLRYDKDAIRHFLERLQAKIMVTMEVLQDSWLYKDGVAAGKAEGLLNGKRDFLRMALRKKFPAMEMPLEIDQIDRPEAFDQLFDEIMEAHNPDDVRTAVQAASRAN